MEMQHFMHHHPLNLISAGSEGDDVKKSCAGCDDALSGEVYACDDPCRFYLHPSCAALPKRIEHFSHPSCPLFLELVPKPQGLGTVLAYRCEACSFEMDAVRGKTFLPGW